MKCVDSVGHLYTKSRAKEALPGNYEVISGQALGVAPDKEE